MKTQFLILAGALSLATYSGWHTVRAQTRQPAQEHEPTVEQCKKDAAAWYSKDAQAAYDTARLKFFADGTPNPTEFGRLSAHDLYVRMHEMGLCIKVDAAQSDRYDNYSYHYYGFIADRMLDFLERHKLLEQFMKEDGEGKR